MMTPPSSMFPPSHPFLMLAQPLCSSVCFASPEHPGCGLPDPWVSRKGCLSFWHVRRDSSCSLLKWNLAWGPSSAASWGNGSSQRLTNSTCAMILLWNCHPPQPPDPDEPLGISLLRALAFKHFFDPQIKGWNRLPPAVCYSRSTVMKFWVQIPPLTLRSLLIWAGFVLLLHIRWSLMSDVIYIRDL